MKKTKKLCAYIGKMDKWKFVTQMGQMENNDCRNYVHM